MKLEKKGKLASKSITTVRQLLLPDAPQNLQYTATSSSVTVTWSPVDGADSYNVYRGSEKVFAENVTDTTFTADGLSADTQLTINVTAVNKAGESPMSEIVTHTLAAA